MTNKPTWRDLIENEKCLVLPGAYDALTARLIEKAGFSAYIVGGFPLVGARYGVPDIGLVGLGEMSAGVQDIMRGSDLPVMVDGDHGYGDVKNVTNTVRTYERLGASAMFLEDQVMPKRCGHMAGKDVVPVEVMETKLRAAAAARNGDLFIVARTDARAIHGLDDALRRCERYIKAGADGVFVEAPETVEELETIAKAFDVPQMCNMLVGGRTPLLSNRELADMGYAMIIHGISLVMRAARVFQDSLAAIRDDRPEAADQFAGFDEFKTIMGFDDWADVEGRFG